MFQHIAADQVTVTVGSPLRCDAHLTVSPNFSPNGHPASIRYVGMIYGKLHEGRDINVRALCQKPENCQNGMITTLDPGAGLQLRPFRHALDLWLSVGQPAIGLQ